MNKKDKKITIAISVLLIALLIAAAVWFLTREPEQIKELPEQTVLAENAISYNENGEIQLYDVADGSLLDEFDLKTLSDSVEKTVTEKVVVEETETKVEKPAVEEKKESYKDFDIVWMSIEKGDNAWTIQKNLTPERNPSTMLSYVREINEHYAMHPIYPGQKYAFLKEKGTNTDQQYENKLTDAPIEFQEAEKAKEVVEEVVMTTTELETDYIYYASQEDDTLYAHSDFNNEVYAITVEGKKLKVKSKWKHTSKVGSPVRFILENNIAYFEYAASNKLVTLELGQNIRTINLLDTPSHRLVVDDVYIYTFGDYIGIYDYKEERVDQAMMGDLTKDLIELKGQVYAINAFGSETAKNLLYKIDPKTLLVERLMEIDSNEATFASYGDTDNLWVSFIEKKKDLEGTLIETELMNQVNTDKLKFNDNLWNFDLLTISYSAKNYLYDLSTPGTVDIYAMGNAKIHHAFSYEGDNLFIVLPN
ncbi:hypothetical protein ABD91_20315 [Lysinibacillus sphaericus]|uniref:hypothetical protein n=1 Tax=Lysinibacillus sphaericus TaxID=1421 RepID=UPI0018CE32C8|nr:hypothetical protein [Lysinibacillus sphaericus]MBG9693094.1 hypothetical protein [Lysinibacillus sphaericus]